MKGVGLASKRRCAAMALIVSAAVSASPIWAATDTQTGTNGADGAHGIVIIDRGGVTVTNGGTGGAGGPADSTAYSNDSFNTSDATGGTGGKGGDGTATDTLVSNGGDGGAGGSASAAAQQLSYIAVGASDTATATGGNGGNGGSRGGSPALDGDGGNGGSASAAASAFSTINGSGSSFVSSSATATGGNGGAGGTANGAGGNGGTASLGTVSVFSSGGGEIDGTTVVYGGNGGHGYGSGKGGDGATESLSNSISGSTSSDQVRFEQSAYGGNSGGSTGGNAGLAGNATSSVSYNQSGVGTPRSFLNYGSATGGDGGASIGTTGSNGGTASSSIDLTYNIVTLHGSSIATGGSGSNLTAGTGVAGAGGLATSTTHVNRLGSFVSNPPELQSAFGFATSTGGRGGSVTGSAIGNAGAGADASAFVTTQTGYSDAQFSLGSLFPDVEANATGGAGGDVTSTANGSAGAGGNASASLSASATDGLLVPSLTSVGGNGGSVTGAGHGNGGAGGGASGSQSISYGASELIGKFTLAGGNGGAGQGSGFAGGAGGTASIGNNSVTGDLGNQTLTIQATGGDGGPGADGAAGGNGGSANLTNTFSATTSINQVAVGGNGGSSDGATPGAAGAASAHQTLSHTGPQAINIIMQARSGKGGDAQNISAANGADGDALTDVSGDHGVLGYASGTGGAGGNITAGLDGYSAGRGGNGVANSTSVGTGIILNQSSVWASTTGSGGSGGGILNGVIGSGGDGGNANATSSASGAGPDFTQATASASGGIGGQGSGNGFASGNGGNATANSTAFSSGGPAQANSYLVAGTSQAPINSALIGTIGSANGTATATGLNQATASAGASEGSSGLCTAIAKANSTGFFSYIQTKAIVPVDRGGIGNCSAAVSQAAPSFPVGPNAHSDAVLVAAPLTTDVTSRWTPDINIKNAFNNDPATVNAIGMTDLRYPTAGSGASHTYSSELELNEDNAHLNSDGLLLGMLAAQLDGNGAGLVSGDSLRFRLQRNGSTLVDQTFTTNPQVLSYFQNAVFDLGPQNAGLNGSNLDLKFLFDLTGSHPDAGIGAQFLLGAHAGAQTGIWNKSTGGSWAIPTNWSANTLPIGPGVTATFGNVITSAQTVALDENTTIGSITFNTASGAYTISPGAGAFSLNLDNAGAPAAINVTAGSHTITAPISIAAPGVLVSLPAVQNLALPGGISGPGAVTKSGDGSVSIGPMTTNGLNVQAGKVQFTPDSAAPARSVGPLAIAPGAVLDIADGKLVTTSPAGTWNGSNYTDVAGLVQSGRATGDGIVSSQIAGPTDKLHSAGVAKAGDVKIISDSETALFAGQTVHGSDTIVMFTYGGDANLDGQINIDDYGLIDSHVGQSGSAFGWHNGDFNYDGKINIDDYGIIDGNIGAQGAPILTTANVLAELSELNGLSAVPEPTTLGLLTLVGAGTMRRRHQH